MQACCGLSTSERDESLGSFILTSPRWDVSSFHFLFYFFLIQCRALVILIIDRSEGFEAFQLPNFGKQAFKKYQIAMWSFFCSVKD